MIIGCVKETISNEFRVGITPDHVFTLLGDSGVHTFLIEENAGLASGYTNEEYQKAGAIITPNVKEVWAKSEMIIKVKEPTPDEFDYIRENQIIYAFLHLAANPKLTQVLLEKKATAIAYETITDKEGRLPLLKPMSEVAGRLCIQEGAKYLEKQYGGSGVLLAGVPGVRRGKVLILGCGNVGQNAVKMAVGIGAEVVVMDNNMVRLEEIDQRYATRAQTIYMTEKSVSREIADADVVVGSILIPGENTPKVIRREHLKLMKPGSVIVDVAIDQGGCAETSRPTTHDDPIYSVDGIIHYCVSNMPGCVPNTSTNSLVNATAIHVSRIAELGLEKAARFNSHLADGINCLKGQVTHKGLAHSLKVPYVDPVSLFKE